MDPYQYLVCVWSGGEGEGGGVRSGGVVGVRADQYLHIVID